MLSAQEITSAREDCVCVSVVKFPLHVGSLCVVNVAYGELNFPMQRVAGQTLTVPLLTPASTVSVSVSNRALFLSGTYVIRCHSVVLKCFERWVGFFVLNSVHSYYTCIEFLFFFFKPAASAWSFCTWISLCLTYTIFNFLLRILYRFSKKFFE